MFRHVRKLLGHAGDERTTPAQPLRAGEPQACPTGVVPPAVASPLLVARQPVFDVTGVVWGYELLFRHPEAPEGGNLVVASDVATASVIADGVALVRPALADGQRLLLNFTEEMLLADMPRILPADICGVEVLETVSASGEVLRTITDLKADGYLVLVDDYVGQAGVQALLDVADIVKVDVLGCPAEALPSVVEGLRGRPCRLLAEKVEDMATYRRCADLGFSLFQGFFFSRPELLRGKRLDSSQAARMRLLGTLAREDVDIRMVVEVVRSDAALSYKLLRYINTVHFGLSVKVTSLQHAVAMLGARNLVQWLCVIVLSEFDTGPLARELMAVSAQRAKFLELCATRAACAGRLPVGLSGPLFMLGLFSLLEPLLCLPLDELLRALPLSEELAQALTGHAGPYAPWLDILECYERGQWEEVLRLTSATGLTRADLAVAYAGALDWTALFHHSRE